MINYTKKRNMAIEKRKISTHTITKRMSANEKNPEKKQTKFREEVVRLLSEYGYNTWEDKYLAMYGLAMHFSSMDGTHDCKMTNGTLPELIACKELDLKWNKDNVHGHDALDSEGKACEIKTFTYKRKGKHKININYHPPAMKNGEDKGKYIKRVEKWIRDSSGGHFWVAMRNRKTEVYRTWKIKSDYLAKIVGDMIRDKNKNIDNNINFGCMTCPDCFGLHRLDIIEKRANENGPFPKKVSTSCGKRSTKRK